MNDPSGLPFGLADAHRELVAQILDYESNTFSARDFSLDAAMAGRMAGRLIERLVMPNLDGALLAEVYEEIAAEADRDPRRLAYELAVAILQGHMPSASPGHCDACRLAEDHLATLGFDVAQLREWCDPAGHFPRYESLSHLAVAVRSH